MQTNDGKALVFSGRSRSGKTAMASKVVDALQFETVFVFDIENQWSQKKGFKRITSMIEFKRIVKSGAKGWYAFVDLSGDLRKSFEQFCACVFYYANQFGACVVVAEELADVTTTAKAPPYWGMLVRRGLKRGVWLLSISQRWQEADKTAMGNASAVYIFQPNNDSDAQYLSKRFDIPVSEISGLQIIEKKRYEYLLLDCNTKKYEKKALTF